MLSAERERVVERARSTLGTPWRHQGRDPVTGLDCAGLIIWVGWETGYLPRSFDVRGYRRMPDGCTLRRALAEQAEQKPWPQWKPGDFVLLRDITTSWPCHLGFLVERVGSEEPNMIHCWARLQRRCVEVRFDTSWIERMTGLYVFRGID